MTAEPLVIATTSRRGFFWVLLFVGAIGAFVVYAWIDAARNWDEFFSDRYSRVGIPIISILWLAMLSIVARASRQVLGHHGRAVWIENGRLIFFYPSYFSAPLTEISALSLTCDSWGWDQIRISLRHGVERKFHITRMSVPPDALVKTLREICGLREARVERP